MLTASAVGVAREIARRDEPRLVGMATPAQAAVAYVEALGALYRRDDERIRRRLAAFTSLPFGTLDKMALKARLDELGDSSRMAR